MRRLMPITDRDEEQEKLPNPDDSSIRNLYFKYANNSEVEHTCDQHMSEVAPSLPLGALELLICMSARTSKGFQGVPVLVWGEPGQGKSSFIESLATDECPVVTIIASIHDPTDFSGLPVHHNGKVRFAPPEWVETFEKNGKGILFLDEITTAPPSVQSALLRIVLERTVGQYQLPSGVIIVAAGNELEHTGTVYDLSPPLLNRFVHISWSFPEASFLNGFLHGFKTVEIPYIPEDKWNAHYEEVRRLLFSFLKFNPSTLSQVDNSEEKAFPTPRTWDYLLSILTVVQSLGMLNCLHPLCEFTVKNLVHGTIGKKVAPQLLDFLKIRKNLDVEGFLFGDKEIDFTNKQMRGDVVYIFFEKTASIFIAQKENQLLSIPVLVKGLSRLAYATEIVRESYGYDYVFPALKLMVDKEVFPWLVSKSPDKATTDKIVKSLQTIFPDDLFNTYVKQIKDIGEKLTNNTLGRALLKSSVNICACPL